jgi:transcriptional regulator with XRE-family HTH domain
MTIGNRIKNRRKYLKMSADELGKRLGKDRSTIYRYEKGDIENLPLDILEPIANALETTPQYLMGWDEKTAPENGSGLSEAKKQLLDLAENCSEEDAEKLLQMMQILLGKK